jgi:DNA-binding winged helix-turn-helix (wHTH) protein
MYVVFGAYELELDQRELRRAGEVVPLEPKAFKVLVYLLTHRHRAVSKSELLETLWPQEYVTESALTRSVRLIRQAVGDAGHQQHIIKTLRGYGYRFMADVILPPAEAVREMASGRLSGEVLDDQVSEGSLAVASPPEALDALVPSPGDAAPLPDIPPKPFVSPAAVHPSADAEHRPLTVLVCDLTQAAQLVEQLDPEDLRQVMRAYHTTCGRVLTQYEGYLAHRLGSRLVVYFGYPYGFEGSDTTVPIYQVIERSGAQHRLEVAPPGGLTPLVGREHEVGLLSERWQRVCEGQGQVVVLSGEAGIGKARLVQVLREGVIREPHVQWECRSSPYYQHTAFYPITELLQRVIDWQSDDDPVVRLGKLEAFLSQSHLSVSETVPLLAPLLSLLG